MKAGTARDGALRMHRRIRPNRDASTRCRSPETSRSAIISAPGGGTKDKGLTGFSSIAIPGICSGSHKAGTWSGFASGAQGKAKTPSPGQTLPQLVGVILGANDGQFGCFPLATIIGIPPQVLLREIGKIMDCIVFGSRRGSPRRMFGHAHLALTKAKQAFRIGRLRISR